jgi:hypothetical protein
MARCREDARVGCSLPWNVLRMCWCGRCERPPGGEVFGAYEAEKKLEWKEKG